MTGIHGKLGRTNTWTPKRKVNKTEKQPSVKNSQPGRAQRRALLGAISTAGVVGAAKLPGQWTRPVVDHVLLPAHASTTEDAGSSPTGGTSSFITTVTSNCAVTCTSAIAIQERQTGPWTGANSTLSSVWYTYLYTNGVSKCVDAFGGMTSTGLNSGMTTYQLGSSASNFPSGTHWSNSTSYTINAICNVTVTSS